jgi:hypothetical protein
VLALRLAVVGVLYLFLAAVFVLARRELRAQAQPRQLVPGHLVLLDAGSTSLPRGHVLPLTARTTIGRSATSTLALNDNFVSSTHAVLAWHDGQWWLRDAGSTNGTYLNQQLVGESEMPVAFGDVIAVGRVQLRLAQ